MISFGGTAESGSLSQYLYHNMALVAVACVDSHHTDIPVEVGSHRPWLSFHLRVDPGQNCVPDRVIVRWRGWIVTSRTKLLEYTLHNID